MERTVEIGFGGMVDSTEMAGTEATMLAAFQRTQTVTTPLSRTQMLEEENVRDWERECGCEQRMFIRS